MTDKERILLNLIKRISITYMDSKEHEGVHFAHYLGGFCSGGNLKAGMLVLCMSSGIHDWTIGYLKEKINDGWAVKELDSDRLCNISNESFLPIQGLNKTELFTGDDYIFYNKVLTAFFRGSEYWYRFGGIDIIEKRKWKIWIREAFGGTNLKEGMKSIPFFLEIKWNKKTSIKYILQKMKDAGYGTRGFERERRIN